MNTATVAVQQYGKSSPPVGRTPAIILINPKYAHNVGAAVRAASCLGAHQVWWTGERVQLPSKRLLKAARRSVKKQRLPREERMKGYNDVELAQFDYPFDAFPKGVTPVAIEVRENSEPLHTFVHPENAVYVFGPEDGSIHQSVLRHCHRFVIIPTLHCVNLAAAVYLTLYDRHVKRVQLGEEQPFELAEQRGFPEEVIPIV